MKKFCDSYKPKRVFFKSWDALSAGLTLAQLRGLFAGSPSQVLELFREIDESGDGIINRSEFTLAIRALGLSLPPEELKELFRLLDPDGSGTIDAREFTALRPMFSFPSEIHKEIHIALH